MASQRYMVDLPTDVMCGGDFFDHMDDLLDFPNDEDMGGIMETPYPYIQHGDGDGDGDGGWGTPAFPTLLSPPPRTESECDGGRGVTSPINRTDTTALDPNPNPNPKAKGGDQLLDDLDIADLEWVSNFMDDSPDSLSLLNFPDAHINGDASTSPVFVLEEPSSFSGGSASSTTASSSSFSYSGASSGKGPTPTPTPTHFNYSPPLPLDPIIISVNVPARARSKRPRPPTYSARPHVTIPFLPPPHPEPESFGESITPPAPAPAVNKFKKKKNNNHPPATGAGGEAVRKCMHCEIQKTPQWRAGPMGPKTLCNACGVRYKSGRLFPEYRPAASPTFVPSIHSNSHKKVVEMRINATHNGPNSCDLLDCIRAGTGVDRAHH